jgi:putative lysine transport system substrate-binding protein
MVLGLAACGSAPAPDASRTPAAAASEAPASAAPETTAGAANESEEPAGTLQFRVGMECAYAPSNWQEDTPSETNYPIENVPGTYAEGYDVQIAKVIAEHLGRELVIVKLAWSGLIDALNQGQIDAIIAGMADTAERREAISFSDPYHTTVYGIMVRSDSAYLGAESINDFAGASVLGQKDTMLDTVIDQMEGVNHLSPVSSVPDMISRLAQGTCDAITINMENSENYLASNPDFAVISFAEGQGFDLGFAGSCVGLRNADTELLEQVNAALATLDDAARDEMWNTAVANQPV